MARAALDFLYLTDPPPVRVPASAVFLAPLLGRLRPARWGRVRFEPLGPGRPASGVIFLARPDDRDIVVRCEARIRAARRAGARIVACGGALAGRESLVRGLVRATGLPVLSGLALEGAVMVDAAGELLRWQGVDPARARALVFVDPANPTLGEAVTEYLAERTGLVAVWGPDRLKRSVLSERVRRTTGAVLEVVRTLEAGLEAADLLVLTGSHRGRAAEAPRATGRRPVVILDLSDSARSPVEPSGHRWLRLSGLQPPVGGQTSPLWPAPHPVMARRVVFLAPSGWRGRPEPGLERGFLSAGLVAAVTAAASPGRPVPASFRRQVTAAAMSRARREGLALGFSPAAVAVTDSSLQSSLQPGRPGVS